MVVAKLIEELVAYGKAPKPVYVSFINDPNKKYFVSIFGNSQGLPTVSICEDEPLPANKKSDIFLSELKSWRDDSVHYLPDADVYLIVNYEYEDNSYDFRYYKLKVVCNEFDSLILIGESEEYLDLRQHFEAFDDDMLEGE